MYYKRSQVTIFLILGVVLIIIFMVLTFIIKQVNRDRNDDGVKDAKQTVLELQPIKNYVEECLNIVSKEALIFLGKQGGVIYRSQGGELKDFDPSRNGQFFIEYLNHQVQFNIKIQSKSTGKFKHDPPNYPWESFPYFPTKNGVEKFDEVNLFGTSELPPLKKFLKPNSMQMFLERFVENKIESNCLDFSFFEDQGFNIAPGDKKVKAIINDKDVIFEMKYDLDIQSPSSGKKTKLKEFTTKHNVRLGLMYEFIKETINSDISDIRFDIVTDSAINPNNFQIQKIPDVINSDDIIIITDPLSLVNNEPYQYIFARKNRNPAMYYIDEPIFFDISRLNTMITNSEIIGKTGIPDYKDPDEDSITRYYDPDFKLTGATSYTIGVTDGELVDYQEVDISISGLIP